MSTIKGPAVTWVGGIWSPQREDEQAVKAAVQTFTRRLHTTRLQEVPAAARGARALLAGPAWAREDATFYRGPHVLSVPILNTPDECEAACAADSQCQQWALCPASAADGCAGRGGCQAGVPVRLAAAAAQEAAPCPATPWTATQLKSPCPLPSLLLPATLPAATLQLRDAM